MEKAPAGKQPGPARDKTGSDNHKKAPGLPTNALYTSLEVHLLPGSNTPYLINGIPPVGCSTRIWAPQPRKTTGGVDSWKTGRIPLFVFSYGGAFGSPATSWEEVLAFRSKLVIFSRPASAPPAER